MNPAAVILFALSAVSLAMGVGFGLAVGDRTGTAVLVSAGVVAAVAGLAAVGAQGRDVAVPGAGHEAPSLAPAGSSVWPLGLGLGALVLATGLATGPALVLLGLAACAVAGVGWFAQSWAGHPSWTDEQNERVTSRLIMPLVLPLGVTALVVLVAFAFSRTLLAVSANAAALIALVGALVVLGAGVLAAVRGLGRRAVLGLLTAGAVAVAGLGVGGAVAGEREFHHAGDDAAHGDPSEEAGAGGGHDEDAPEDDAHAGDTETTLAEDGVAAAPGAPAASAPPSVELVTNNLEFDQEAITLPAQRTTTITLINEENKPHNVAIRDEEGDLAFRPEGGGIITGPGAETEYEVPPLEAGEYTFFCEVHPIMKGELTVA